METHQTRSSKFSVQRSRFDALPHHASTLTLLLLLLAAGSAGATVRYVDANSTNATPPYTNWSTAARVIQDAVDAAAPGDEIVVTNGTYATGGRAVGTNILVNRVAVDKPITLLSVNGPEATIIRGYKVPGTTNGDGAIRCVYLTNGAVLSGFTLSNGATRTLFGPSTGESDGGGVWCETGALVTNCTFTYNTAYWSGGGAYGGTLENCTSAANWAGEYGGGAAGATLHRCTLANNFAGYEGGAAEDATLNECILTGNKAPYGGGVSYGTLSRCTLASNSAEDGGGGSYNSTLSQCILVNNSSGYYSGGAGGGTLNQCILVGNSALFYGGGADSSDEWGCDVNNCILYSNTAPTGDNYTDWPDVTLSYCCTTPMSTNGVGNITNAPLFVDFAGGNLRLQSNSPCINAGLNAYAPAPTDLDGNPRIVRGTVDIGAYEFQGPGSVISYAWLQQYGLPIDGSADTTDPDADSLNTWQEWRCLTDPTNALSVLRLLSPLPAGTNVTVTWQSVAGVSYFLERSTNLSANPPFNLLAPNLPGQPGTTTFTDTNASAASGLFYRVGVP
jgi:hypothetical protein